MLLALTALLAWIPAVLGWGLPALLVRRRLDPAWRGRSPEGWLGEPVTIAEPVAGVGVLALLAIGVHFLRPIGPALAAAVLFCGWLLCAVRARIAGVPPATLWGAAWAFVWLLLMAWWASTGITQFDSGLYHLQTVKWMLERPMPLGVANLHDRLGFNSSWLAAQAWLCRFTLRSDAAGFCIGPTLLLWWYGLGVGAAAWRLARPRTGMPLADIFLVLTPLALRSTALRLGIASLSTDIPVLLADFLCVVLALRAAEEPERRAWWLWSALLAAVLAVTAKLSSLPLLALPAFSAVAAWRARPPRGGRRVRRLLALAAGTGLIVAAPWMARGLALSGYWAYPMPCSRVGALPWAVPRAAAARTEAVTRAWARLPYRPMEEARNGTAWMDAWAERTWALPQARTLRGLAGLWVALVAVRLALRRTRIVRHPKTPMRAARTPGSASVFAALALALSYWLVMAPDLRFGEGYCLSIAFLLLAAEARAWAQTVLPAPREASRAWRIAGLILVGCAALPMLAEMLPPPWHGSAGEFFWRWPAIPRPPLRNERTVDGTIVWTPQDVRKDDRCWLAPLPCALTVPGTLRCELRPGGRYVFRSDGD